MKSDSRLRDQCLAGEPLLTDQSRKLKYKSNWRFNKQIAIQLEGKLWNKLDLEIWSKHRDRLRDRLWNPFQIYSNINKGLL